MSSHKPNAPGQGCARCGACLPLCPVYRLSGREEHSPRGRVRLFELGSKGAMGLEALSACLLCGACESACSRNLDIRGMVIAARGERGSSLAAKAVVSTVSSGAKKTALAKMARLLGRATGILPQDSGLLIKLGLGPVKSPEPPEESIKKQVHAEKGPLIFSGCLARHLMPRIIEATRELEAAWFKRELITIADERCCGLAAMAAGRLDLARDLARRNIAAFAGDGEILTTCASCFHQLKTYPKLLAEDRQWAERAQKFADRVSEFSRHFAAADLPSAPISPGEKRLVAAWHDPCHLKFDHEITAEPRQLLASVPGLELAELPVPGCCGMGGTFSLNHPDLSRLLMEKRLLPAHQAGIELVVTSCSGCLIQWQRHAEQGGAPITISHPALLLTTKD